MHRPLLSIPSSGKQYFVQGLLRSDLVFSYTELVHPLLGGHHSLHLELVGGVHVRQTLLLASAVTQVLVHSSHRKDDTHHLNVHPCPASTSLLLCPLRGDALGNLYTTTWWCGQHQCVRARNLMQAICCGRRAAANFWFLLRLGRLQYFISQFCDTKNLLRPQKKWLKISLTAE